MIYKFYWETGVASGSFASKVFGKHIISPNEQIYDKIIEEMPNIQIYKKVRNLNSKRV